MHPLKETFKNSSVLRRYRICLSFIPKTMQHHHYIYNIYIVLDIKSNLEVSKSTWENICKFFANIMPVYIIEMSICKF